MKSPKIIQAIKEKIGGKVSTRLSKLSYRQFFFMIAVVCSAVFVFLLLVLPEGQSDQPAKPKQQAVKPKVETVKVYTAARDIPPRTILREDMFTLTEMPSNVAPAGYVTDIKTALNLPAAVALQKGDVLTSKKFYADIRMAGFPGRIPDDCRAVSIGISDITGVAGFAKPGDRVDVMAVIGKRGSKDMVANLILQDVLLLGINKSAKVDQPNTGAGGKEGQGDGESGNGEGSGGEGGKDKNKGKEAAEPGSTASAQAMATATVAVSPADALKLAVASQSGTLYLALRPVVPKETIVAETEYTLEVGGDDDEESNQSAASASRSGEDDPYHRTYEQRVAAYTPQANVPLPPANAESPPAGSSPSTQPESTVEVIRGTKSETVRSE